MRPIVARVKDEVVLGMLLVSFATFVTTHVFIAGRLLWRVKPRYRGLIALIVMPLAPLWAYREKWRVSCWLWVGAVVSYAAFAALASV